MHGARASPITTQMTDNNEKLTATLVLKGVRELLTKDGKELTNEDLLTLCQPFYELTDYTDEDTFRKELEKVLEAEAFTEDCLKTFTRDAQQFCAVGFAPVKMAYMQSFTGVLPWNVMQLDQAQDVWVAAYKRLVETEYGLTLITQTRFLVCNWFAKWKGNEGGDFSTFRNHLFDEWDAWEREAGGVNGDGKELSVEFAKSFAPDTVQYQESYAGRLAMVMATDAWYQDNEGDAEALTHWPINQELYSSDVAYVSKAMKLMSTPEIGSRFFDALMETFIPLIGHTARFQNITGLWAVRRLEELLNLEATGEPVAQAN